MYDGQNPQSSVIQAVCASKVIGDRYFGKNTFMYSKQKCDVRHKENTALPFLDKPCKQSVISGTWPKDS